MRRFIFLLVTAFLLPLVACANDNDTGHADAQPAITVYVTVDWEGWSLEPENIEAMQAFRLRHPEIPMLQLLNPAYWVRPGTDVMGVTRQVHATLLPEDAHGLHLHAWRSLVEACGVPYQHGPLITDGPEPCPHGECGYTVSLEYAYTESQLTQLVGCSADLLVRQGFDRPRMFRAGAWQFGPKLAAALRANGFKVDSSRTDARFLTQKWGDASPIVRMVGALHPGSSVLDQPYELLPGLMELPNNGSLADYTTTVQIMEAFRTLLEEKKRVMVLGFHQETAFDFLDHLEAAIPQMEAATREAGVRLEWARYRGVPVSGGTGDKP